MFASDNPSYADPSYANPIAETEADLSSMQENEGDYDTEREAEEEYEADNSDNESSTSSERSPIRTANLNDHPLRRSSSSEHLDPENQATPPSLTPVSFSPATRTLKNSEWAVIWLGMFYAKLHVLFKFKSTTSERTQEGVLRCVNELIIAYQHLQTLADLTTPQQNESITTLQTELIALHKSLVAAVDKNIILNSAKGKLTELAHRYQFILPNASSYHEDIISLNNFAEILSTHLTSNDMLEKITDQQREKLSDSFRSITSLLKGPIKILMEARSSSHETTLTITPATPLAFERKEDATRPVISPVISGEEKVSENEVQHKPKAPKAARVLDIDDLADAKQNVLAPFNTRVTADRFGLNSLPTLPREVDDEIEEIVRRLQATKRNSDLSQQALNDAIDAAREKITWLIILNDKYNSNTSYLKMVCLGALGVWALSLILALTGAVTIPVIAGSLAIGSLVYALAPLVVGGLCGAAAKKIAACTHSYRFGIFKEPAAMADINIANTILARGVGLSK